MKATRIFKRKIVLAISAGFLLGLSCIGAVYSRDTDIYFSNPNATQQSIKPNIMVIIDTSGSMVTNEVSPGVTRLQAMKDAFNTILDDPATKGIKMGVMRFSGANAGPVLFPVADLDAKAVDIVGNDPVTVEGTLSASSDDAEERVSTGAVTLSSTTLDLINTGSYDQVVGLRFQNIMVPKGATITAAYILFLPNTNDSGATSLTIKAQNIGDAATFTTATNDVSNRTNAANAVGASVAWNSVPAWTTTGGDRVATPDITSLVQPIINRSDWCGGNSMALTLSGSGTRRASSYDSSAASAPILVIQYDPTTVPAGTCNTRNLQVRVKSSNDDAEERVSGGTMDRNNSTIYMIRDSSNRDQYVGLRFQNIAIPAGATILSAYIDFTISATDSSSPSYTIVGQKALTPGSFTSTSGNISGRISAANATSASVSWASVANPSAGSTLTSPDIKSILQELVNQSGWTSGNPIVLAVKGSGTRRIVSYDGNTGQAPLLRIKYQANDSATASTDTVRTRLKQIVNGLNASGSTPIVDSLWEAGLYFRGKPVLYGKQRGDQSGTDAQYTRVSHPKTYTGATGVFRDPACTDTNLDASACVTEEILGSPTYTSPFEDGCQNSYIVLLTDGAPTVNNSVSLVQSLISPQTCAGSGSGECSNELAAYYLANNLSSYSDKHNIVTHTVGFGSDLTNATDVQYLTDLATAGGGTFTPAQDATQLVSAFQGILSKVNSAPTAFVSPSLSVNAFNKLFNRDEVYFSLFSPQLQVRWPGNVKKFKLCNDPTNATCNFGDVLDANNQSAIGTNSKILATAQSIWSSSPDGPTVELGGSGSQIPARASRKIYTYTGTSDTPASPVDLSATPVNTTNVTKTMLGDAAMTNARQSDIINWMLGQDIKDEDNDANTAEDRWKFADALHSRPLTVNYGGTDANPVIKIFVGTNDGALRLINTNNGKEEWSVYLPEFLPVQGVLMDDTQGVHVEGMDGTPTAYVIDNNANGKIEPGNGDKVYLFIGERRGGRYIYAFDVTPTSEITDPAATDKIVPKLLWRIKGGSGSFAALGQTWSRPIITKIRIKCGNSICNDGNAATQDSELKTVLMFAGGYDPQIDTPGANNVVPSGADTMGNAIYIVDPLTGSRVWWVSGTGSGANVELANMKYAIPSDLALLDTNGDGATDRIYVGDSRGQVWRIDLGDQIDPGQAGTGGSSGYVFADLGCQSGSRTNDCSATSRQNHVMFYYPPEVAQVEDKVYSTIASYDLVVIGSGNREDPLDKLTATVSSTEEPVHNRIYALRDYNYKTGAPAAAQSAITESNLYDATNNNLGTLTGGSLTSEIDTYVKNSKGWFLQLKESSSPNWVGEKALAKPVIFGGELFFTTFVPSSSSSSSSTDKCAPLAEGAGRLYAVNYLNATAIYDFDKDGTKDRQTQVGGGIPSEAVIVIREGGVTTLVGTSGGAASPDVDLALPRYPTYWYEE